MTWQDFYAHVTNPFGAAGPHYNGGHHGADYAAKTHQNVPAYFTGVCVRNDHSSILGYVTEFKTSDGEIVGFAHCLVGTRRNIGEHVKPGDTIYKAAGRSDDHGSAWDGPHCHTTLSHSSLDGVFGIDVVNPAPYIAKLRAASLKPKPAPKPTAKKIVTVKDGDTLTKIAAANKTTVPKILALPQTPKITDPNKIKIGQKVRVK